MFAVPSGVEVESETIDSPPGTRVASTGRRTGAQRLTGVAKSTGRNRGLKAGATGSGRSPAGSWSAAGARGVPWGAPTTSAAATTTATPTKAAATLRRPLSILSRCSGAFLCVPSAAGPR